MKVKQITQLPALPARPEDGHKGTFGRALIFGGSRGMSGAVTLAGQGALRGGAGLVYLAVPAGIQDIVAACEPSYLTIALPDDQTGCSVMPQTSLLSAMIADKDVVAIGPGWGQSESLLELCRWLLLNVEKPVVVDADGLNLLAQCMEVLTDGPVPRILTPHPGEFARLLNVPLRKVTKNPDQLAAQFAYEHDLILVLKGHRTIITDGNRISWNPTGNSGMATGGTGDVLTGIITALLAQGMQAFDAAQLGVYLHGLTGDLAVKDLSEPGLISSDLPKYLPAAWKQLTASSATKDSE